MAFYNDFLIEGKKVEERFGKDLICNCGGDIVESTDKEDKYDHIDLYWGWQGSKIVSFDVKGLRKTNRGDNDYNYETTWIELMNVGGNPGSIYGKATYITFEGRDEWIIVNRKKLIEFVEEKVIDKTIYPTKEGLYKLYRRKGRMDMITQVPYSDLYSIASKIIKKTY